jgi:cytochrome c5
VAISANAIAAGAVVGVMVLRAPIGGNGCLALAADAQSASTVTGGGVTLRSVSLAFPDDTRIFPGGSKADVVNNNCLTCHSAGMVLTQPSLSRADWQAEVEKMRNAYKAPVAAGDVPGIVDYLAGLRSGQ